MDHEKLDVYRVSLEVVRSVGQILKQSTAADRVIRDQIFRSSTSILLNIAEGTGKRSPADRRRFYEIARGSAMETGAALDVLLVLEYAREEQVSACKTLLRRVIAMFTKMTEMSRDVVRESESIYSQCDLEA